LQTISSAQRTRVSRANPLPPSGDRSKAVMVMVMVIVRLLLGENHRLRAGRPVIFLLTEGQMSDHTVEPEDPIMRSVNHE
jgi:hypothetical protein